MKHFLLNNTSAFIVHLVLILVMVALLFALKKTGLAPEMFPAAHILSFVMLVLYFLSGYFLSGSLCYRYDNVLMNFLSVSGIFFLGIILWIYCAVNQGSWFIQMNYLLYVPFSASLNELLKISEYSKINLIYSAFPSILVCAGIYSRK